MGIVSSKCNENDPDSRVCIPSKSYKRTLRPDVATRVETEDSSQNTETMSISPEVDLFRVSRRPHRYPPAVVQVTSMHMGGRRTVIARPTSSGRSSRRPIPQRRRSHSAPHTTIATMMTSPASAEEEEQIRNLKRIYDMRTWDMYIRITKSLQHKSCSAQTMATTAKPVAVSSTQSTAVTQTPVLEAVVTPPEPDLELFFGDLDEVSND